MKTTIKVLALILALVMILPVVIACKKDDTNTPSTTTANNDVISTEDPTATKLPDIDWGGEYCDIFGRDGGSEYGGGYSRRLSCDVLFPDCLRCGTFQYHEFCNECV